jgi:hypothetical protein
MNKYFVTKDNPLNDADRFALAMSQVAGHRLTCSELTGKDESPRHEATGTGKRQFPSNPCRLLGLAHGRNLLFLFAIYGFGCTE